MKQALPEHGAKDKQKDNIRVDPTEYSGDTFTVSYDAATQTITLTGEYASFVFKKATT